jgi:Fe-S cluster assembly scaffold protein SufB
MQTAYSQIDNKIQAILQMQGAEILPSKSAWEEYAWTRKYFSRKPENGYFIWVKKQIKFPLSTCIFIATKKFEQNLENLLVIEKGVKAEMFGACSSMKKNLCSSHIAKGKIILKKGSVLKYEHLHSWGKDDIVKTSYEFVLEKNSKLNYFYKTLLSPKKLKIDTKITCFENASAKMSLIGDFKNSEAKIEDAIVLKKKNSSGIVQLRIVARENAKISTCSKIIAEEQSKGHLDCQGLLVGDKQSSVIKLAPKLVSKNSKSQLTHEASIGKISDEELVYLQTRGLTQKQAIDLIVSGFLEK